MTGQINAFLKLAFKYGFCNKVCTIGATAEEADKVLFKKVMSANHCIHFLLPSIKSSRYSLGAKGHPYQLPRCEYELQSLLFLDVSIEIVTVKQSAFSLFAFVCVYLYVCSCLYFLCAFFSRVSDSLSRSVCCMYVFYVL